MYQNLHHPYSPALRLQTFDCCCKTLRTQNQTNFTNPTHSGLLILQLNSHHQMEMRNAIRSFHKQQQKHYFYLPTKSSLIP